MKQLLQNLRTGETEVVEVPVPTPGGRGAALVRTSASLVSAGTERTLVEFAGKSSGGQGPITSGPGAPGGRQGPPGGRANDRRAAWAAWTSPCR